MKKYTHTSSILVATFIAGTSAYATEIDISSYVNFSYSPLGLSGSVQGNAGTTFSSQFFNLISTSGGANNLWYGKSPNASIDIGVDIPNPTRAWTLMNTFWGEPVEAATVKFEGTGGSSITFTLVGGTNIRDINNGYWTTTINGTTTQEWANQVGPIRMDAQFYNLGSTFAGETLTDIVFTAGPTTSINPPWVPAYATAPALFAVDVNGSAAPEPSTWAMMLLGFAGLGALGLRQAKLRAHAA